MAITSYSQTRIGTTTLVTVVSDLAGTIYYHWYLDGAYIASTGRPSYGFVLEAGDRVRIEVVDTNNPAFDPVANPPAGWPARRSIFWIRSITTDVDHYRVEQKKGAGAWTSVGIVFQSGVAWSHSVLSARLDDLADYEWRVMPVDAAGNDGTAIALDAETIVRTPDAPDFTVTFDEPTKKVTFAAA